MTPGVNPADGPSDIGAARNVVVLCGRVSTVPDERTLPSGDMLVMTRVVVDRDAPGSGRSGGGRSKQRVDAIDCVAWTARVQRSIRRWQPGDGVYVEGAIRRRFYRGDHGLVSRVEVEVTRARRLSTAGRPKTPPSSPGGSVPS